MSNLVSYNKQWNDGDNIYINLSTVNTGTGNGFVFPAKVEYSRPQGIISEPKNYKMIVERFSVSTQSVPYFSLGDRHTVTLVYNNGNNPEVYTETLQIIQSEPINPVTGQPYTTVFNLQLLADVVNNGFTTAFANLLIGSPATTATAPPKMIFNNETKKFELYIPTTGYNYTYNNYINGTVEVYFNTYTNSLFYYPSYYFFGEAINNDMYTRINVIPTGHNIISVNAIPVNSNGLFYDNSILTDNEYYLINQESSTIGTSITDIDKILLVSQNLPVRNEYVGSVEESNNSNNSFTPIISDFKITLERDQGLDEEFTYFNSNETREIDLLSSGELKNFSIQCFYTDKIGVMRPVTLGLFQGFQVKLKFERKYSKTISNINID